MNVHAYLPIAAGLELEDIAIGLVVFLFLAILGIGQLLAKIRQARQAEQRRRGGPIARPGGMQPGVPPARDPVRAEIDEFLREAAGRGDAGRPQQARQVGPPQPPAPAWRPSTTTPPWLQEEPVHVEPVELELLPENTSVAEHVRQQAARQEFRALPSDVGTGLSETGRSIKDRLHGVFDHRLSTLGETPGESAHATQAEEAETPEDRITPLPAVAAAGLAALFADSRSVRQAILINEILQRPEHRW